MPVETLVWVGDRPGHVRMIEQTLLPTSHEQLEVKDVPGMVDAIYRLAVRGAPAIGVAAGYGVLLGVQGLEGLSGEEMMGHVKEVLENLKKEFPDLRGGHEIAGFGWHQGWNDGCDMGACREYEENMKNFIRDVRQELGVEKLPFVIADSGFGGRSQSNERRLMIKAAQAAPTKAKEFKTNVACVETAEFFRPAEESPSNQGYHWNGNAETYYLIGEAMGEAMVELMGAAGPTEPAPAVVHVFRSADGAKSFKGRLDRYDPATKKVTVRRENGKLMTFDLHHLHEDDQEFVTSGGQGEE